MCKSRNVWGRTASGVGLGALLVVAAVTAAATTAGAASRQDGAERFTAFAVNLGSSPGLEPRRRSGVVEITIERWSTPQETEQLVSALQDGGPDALLAALRKTPRVGYIRTPDSISWNLHYASQAPTEGGGRRISIATDRPLAFWEVANSTRTVDYPFTVVELHMGPDGKGEGRMSLLTKITTTADKRYIVLDNYSTEPVRLQEVRVKQ